MQAPQIVPVAAPSIVNAGTELLNQLTSILVSNGLTLPALTGILPGGSTPFDGEQLSIAWVQTYQTEPLATDIPAARAQLIKQSILWHEFDVYLLRVVPALSGRGQQGGIPSRQVLATSFQQLATDATQMLSAVLTLRASNMLVPAEVPFKFGPLTSVGPEGVLAGCRMPIAFQAGMSVDGSF